MVAVHRGAQKVDELEWIYDDALLYDDADFL
jgi:hypothetical protein